MLRFSINKKITKIISLHPYKKKILKKKKLNFATFASLGTEGHSPGTHLIPPSAGKGSAHCFLADPVLLQFQDLLKSTSYGMYQWVSFSALSLFFFFFFFLFSLW